MKNESEIPVLVAEIKDELQRLEKVVESLAKRKGPLASEEITDSTALRLHNLYTGCERIFKRIVAEVNGIALQDLDWHKRLLNQMALEIKEVRPAIITPETRRDLEALLRFRHVVRNFYGYELVPERIEPLVSLCVALYPRFVHEVEDFITFLNGIYHSSRRLSSHE